jgi:hypothetical protein
MSFSLARRAIGPSKATIFSLECPSVLIQFQSESSALERQLYHTRRFYSSSSVRLLRRELSEGELECDVLRESLACIGSDLEHTLREIEFFRASRVSEMVQKQRQKLRRLTTELDQLMQTHQRLRTEHFMLSDAQNWSADEASKIDILTRRLVAVRRRHFEKREELISLRNTQLGEMLIVVAEIEAHAAGNARDPKPSITESLALLVDLRRTINEPDKMDSDTEPEALPAPEESWNL